MRTTLTIDDALARELRKRAHDSGRPFKAVVNEALQAGLEKTASEPVNRRYQLAPTSLGQSRSGIDLEKALQLAGNLEDEELACKQDLRK